MLERLHDALTDAGIPVDGVAGEEGSVRVDYKAEATQQQQTQGQGIVDAFDWSEAAQLVWENANARTEAVANLANTAASFKLIRSLMLVTLDEINILRSAASLTPRTINQLRNAIINKLNVGDADN
jgi:hypothetical protein